MSLYGALMTGVAGLDANSAALSVASSNIANSNTVGYKTSQSAFSTLLASSVSAGDISSAGVIENTQQNITQQGLLQTTTVPTNLAISGNGFFIVNQSTNASGASDLYTRAGDFTPDANGNLVNSAGYYLMGWALDADGNLPTDRNDLTAVNIDQLSGKAEPTTTMSMQANLDADSTVDSGYTTGDITAGNVDADFTRGINVYDSQGGTQPLQFSYIQTGANSWSYEVTYQGDSSKLGSATNPIATGNLTFNSDGTLASVTDTTGGSSTTSTDGSVDITIPWDASASGLQPQTISLNFGTLNGSDGLTQFNSESTLTSSSVNGALFGSLTGVTVDQNGYVTAQFSNGLTQNIYKIPLATFANADGLGAVSGNAYQVTNNSGTPIIGEASTGSAGAIQSDSLESSTVDLATEFTNMITTQRAYEASARIVTTATDMLDELMQMAH